MVFAYLDPGSGSLLLQALLGGLAGLAVGFKAWRMRLAAKVRKTDSIDVPASDDEEPSPSHDGR